MHFILLVPTLPLPVTTRAAGRQRQRRRGRRPQSAGTVRRVARPATALPPAAANARRPTGARPPRGIVKLDRILHHCPSDSIKAHLLIEIMLRHDHQRVPPLPPVRRPI